MWPAMHRACFCILAQLQETHHEMRIPDRDVSTYIVLSVYLLLRLYIDIHLTRTSPIRHKIYHTQVNFIKLKTFEFELDFAKYIQHAAVWIEHPYHLPGNVTSATVSLVYINLQPEYKLSSSTRFGQFQKFNKFELGQCPPATPKEIISA